MNQQNAAARFLSVLLVCFLFGFGWLGLLGDGISLSGRSGKATHVTGAWAASVSAVSFLFAAISSLLLSRAFALNRRALLFIIAMILLPPALYYLL